MISVFRINKRQAEAILAMRLRQLKKLEEKEIKKENEELNSYKKELNKLLKSKKEQIKELNLEFIKSLEIFSKDENATNRKTVVNTEYKEIDYSTEEFERKDPVTVILSKNGWIKTIKGHQDDYTNVK